MRFKKPVPFILCPYCNWIYSYGCKKPITRFYRHLEEDCKGWFKNE